MQAVTTLQTATAGRGGNSRCVGRRGVSSRGGVQWGVCSCIGRPSFTGSREGCGFRGRPERTSPHRPSTIRVRADSFDYVNFPYGWVSFLILVIARGAQVTVGTVGHAADEWCGTPRADLSDWCATSKHTFHTSPSMTYLLRLPIAAKISSPTITVGR